MNLNDFRFNDGKYRRFLDELFEHLEGVQLEHALMRTIQYLTTKLPTAEDDETLEDY